MKIWFEGTVTKSRQLIQKSQNKTIFAQTHITYIDHVILMIRFVYNYIFF